jgi:hypothetical protein
VNTDDAEHADDVEGPGPKTHGEQQQAAHGEEEEELHLLGVAERVEQAEVVGGVGAKKGEVIGEHAAVGVEGLDPLVPTKDVVKAEDAERDAEEAEGPRIYLEPGPIQCRRRPAPPALRGGCVVAHIIPAPR